MYPGQQAQQHWSAQVAPWQQGLGQPAQTSAVVPEGWPDVLANLTQTKVWLLRNTTTDWSTTHTIIECERCAGINNTTALCSMTRTGTLYSILCAVKPSSRDQLVVCRLREEELS